MGLEMTDRLLEIIRYSYTAQHSSALYTVISAETAGAAQTTSYDCTLGPDC